MDIATLIPQFGGALWTFAAFVVALSVIVFVHEYGHYIVGRWSGIRAEVFSIGFGPVLLKRTDRRGTQWQVAALPFGGYVKFLGDASAASDKASDTYDQLDEDTKRHTMHGAPLWARAATVAAGPVFNFILSILVFAAILLWQGTPREPVQIGTLKPMPEAAQGLLPGDTILAVSGTETPDYQGFFDVVREMPVTESVRYDIDRAGEQVAVEGPYPFPPLVEGLQAGSAAMDVGIETGDVITAIDGTPLIAFKQLQEAVGESDGKPLALDIWRDGETLEFVLAPRRVDLPTADGGFETRWLIGMTGGLMFTPATETPGVLESLQYGVDQTGFIIQSSLSGLWHMVTGAISACNLRGPIGIAETSGAAASQGVDSFIWFIAVLSTAVGMLNLFPIPVLDGGHLVFHAYEALAGRPPSDKALRLLMGVGLSLMLALMAFALTNDLFCP
ncbi:RIP metalloprotease RseP [Tropicimonas sediminicola]|uniref:Zinc metalloprotease n=1 Tax=Tropicimonas sediminicola TaxID=1031541 RepID=A0A239HEX8_9RHOB|nr:RIP metalloprotease RseP [Tropicimonas sediminicola]SNS79588.1 regulator of sigma E protease [Tropicimonas sediminicola]